MRNFIKSSLFVWLAITGLIVWRLWPIKDHIKFGMDLVGGTFLTLQVQTDKAVEAELMNVSQNIPEVLSKENLAAPIKKDVINQSITMEFSDVNGAAAAANYLRDNYKDLAIKPTEKSIVCTLKEKRAERVKDDAVEANTQIFRNRLNSIGVEEVSISRKGADQIIVELPAVDDPQVARSMIGKPAVLEFKLVEKTGRDEASILVDFDGMLPDGKEILPDKNKVDGKPEMYYLVSRYAEVKGSMLRNAKSTVGGKFGAQPVVQFEFDSIGGDRFYDLTSKNPGRQVAIVLDDQVISAPVINAAIRSSGYIEGQGFTAEGTKELAMLLKSGALVAPVSIEEDRKVGATLGQESIQKGIFSCIIGLGLLFLFSIVYYKLSGLLAFLALVFNLIFVMFGMNMLGATLTLPGIAGMVLTVGMAIDASVLIYEQIKDALREGISIKKAVDVGFSNAMAVILDSNITTFIVGVVLYQFGTGAIKGFAVTTMLGIVATLIAGLLLLRSMFSFVLNTFNIKKLSI